MIKFVVFDVMGVVFEVGDDVEGLLIPYIRSLKPDTEPRYIRETYLAASLGVLPSHEFWAKLGFPKARIPEIEQYYLEKAFTLDAGFLPCAEALRRHYRIALLSNDVSEWSRYLRRFHKIEPLLTAAFISGDLGVRKPDPQIYRMVLEALGVQPWECVLIDDYPERVEAALYLGFSAILFDRAGHNCRGLRVSSFGQLTQLLL